MRVKFHVKIPSGYLENGKKTLAKNVRQRMQREPVSKKKWKIARSYPYFLAALYIYQ